MRIIWSEEATQDFEEAVAFIAADNRTAATKLAISVLGLVESITPLCNGACLSLVSVGAQAPYSVIDCFSGLPLFECDTALGYRRFPHL